MPGAIRTANSNLELVCEISHILAIFGRGDRPHAMVLRVVRVLGLDPLAHGQGLVVVERRGPSRRIGLYSPTCSTARSSAGWGSQGSTATSPSVYSSCKLRCHSREAPSCAKGRVIGCDCGGEDVPGRFSTARHAPSLTRGHRHPWLCRAGTISAGWKVAMWSRLLSALKKSLRQNIPGVWGQSPRSPTSSLMLHRRCTSTLSCLVLARISRVRRQFRDLWWRFG